LRDFPLRNFNQKIFFLKKIEKFEEEKTLSKSFREKLEIQEVQEDGQNLKTLDKIVQFQTLTLLNCRK